MYSSFSALRDKEVIDIASGCKIGYVDDINIDIDTAELESLVIYGRSKWFGLFGREEDVKISWKDITSIGADTILVKPISLKISDKRKKTSYFEKIFG